MSKLWGLISSMQFIVLLPLMSVRIPANVQLIYYFISYNMNWQIIPMDLEAYGILSFNEPEEEGADAYTREFEEQGYPYISMLQNLSENFMNVISTSVYTLIYLFVYHVVSRVHR